MRKPPTASPHQRVHQINENDRMLELIRNIGEELNMEILCKKILTNIQILTQAEKAVLYVAMGPKDPRYLIPKICDPGKTKGKSITTRI